MGQASTMETMPLKLTINTTPSPVNVSLKFLGGPDMELHFVKAIYVIYNMLCFWKCHPYTLSSLVNLVDRFWGLKTPY